MMQERHKIALSGGVSIAVVVLFVSIVAYFLHRREPIPPPWCEAACERDGGVQWFEPAKTVAKCKDGMFYGTLSVENCSVHGGIRDRTNIDSGPYCVCNSGGLIDEPVHPAPNEALP